MLVTTKSTSVTGVITESATGTVVANLFGNVDTSKTDYQYTVQIVNTKKFDANPSAYKDQVHQFEEILFALQKEIQDPAAQASTTADTITETTDSAH